MNCLNPNDYWFDFKAMTSRKNYHQCYEIEREQSQTKYVDKCENYTLIWFCVWACWLIQIRTHIYADSLKISAANVYFICSFVRWNATFIINILCVCALSRRARVCVCIYNKIYLTRLISQPRIMVRLSTSSAKNHHMMFICSAIGQKTKREWCKVNEQTKNYSFSSSFNWNTMQLWICCSFIILIEPIVWFMLYFMPLNWYVCMENDACLHQQQQQPRHRATTTKAARTLCRMKTRATLQFIRSKYSLHVSIPLEHTHTRIDFPILRVFVLYRPFLNDTFMGHGYWIKYKEISLPLCVSLAPYCIYIM